MRDKVIHKEQIRFGEEQKARLSYDMVFDESHDEIDQDTRQVLEQTEKEWEAKLVRERQSAIEEGYQAGYNDGYTKAKEEIDQQVAPVRQALNELNTQIAGFSEQIKPAVTSLIFEIAEKVISVPVENEALQHQVTRAVGEWLNRLQDEQQVWIYVSEADYEAVRSLLSEQDSHVKLSVVAEMDPGEFRVETNHQAIIQDFKRHLATFRSQTEVKELLPPEDA